MNIKYNGGNCTGCKLCAVLCAFAHQGSFNPRHGRVKVLKGEPDMDIPIVCNQCKRPKCKDACPENAFNGSAGVITVDEHACNGCGECIAACPFDAIWLHPVTSKALKCDLCDERPCIEFCPAQVLELKGDEE